MQAATVTFLYTPGMFTRCGPGRKHEVRAKFGVIEAVVVIDSDFWD